MSLAILRISPQSLALYSIWMFSGYFCSKQCGSKRAPEMSLSAVRLHEHSQVSMTLNVLRISSPSLALYSIRMFSGYLCSKQCASKRAPEMSLSAVRLHEHSQVFDDFECTQDIFTVSRSLFDTDVLRIFMLKTMCKQARSRNVSKRCLPARTPSSFDFLAVLRISSQSLALYSIWAQAS